MRLISLLIVSSLALTACKHRPDLPDPSIQLEPPPAALMVKPEKLKPIEVPSDRRN